jgi:hypothetical protein
MFAQLVFIANWLLNLFIYLFLHPKLGNLLKLKVYKKLMKMQKEFFWFTWRFFLIKFEKFVIFERKQTQFDIFKIST